MGVAGGTTSPLEVQGPAETEPELLEASFAGIAGYVKNTPTRSGNLSRPRPPYGSRPTTATYRPATRQAKYTCTVQQSIILNIYRIYGRLHYEYYTFLLCALIRIQKVEACWLARQQETSRILRKTWNLTATPSLNNLITGYCIGFSVALADEHDFIIQFLQRVTLTFLFGYFLFVGPVPKYRSATCCIIREDDGFEVVE